MSNTAISRLPAGSPRAFVATVDGRVVATGSWDRLVSPQRAELSLVFHDAAAEGLAPTLLQEIAVDAARAGIRRFVNETAADDVPVRRAIQRAGFETATVYQPGVVRSTFRIA